MGREDKFNYQLCTGEEDTCSNLMLQVASTTWVSNVNSIGGGPIRLPVRNVGGKRLVPDFEPG